MLITLLSQNGIESYSAELYVKSNTIFPRDGVIITPPQANYSASLRFIIGMKSALKETFVTAMGKTQFDMPLIGETFAYVNAPHHMHERGNATAGHGVDECPWCNGMQTPW